MTTLLVVLLFILIMILLIVTAMRPIQSEYSLFELQHRSSSGDREAKRELKREEHANDIMSLQRVAVALLLVTIALVGVIAYGWLVGVVVVVVVALEYGVVARLKFIKALAVKIYKRIEKSIIKFIAKVPFVIKLIRNVSETDAITKRLGSRFELQNIINESMDTLTADEKNLIVNGLSFNDEIVSQVMTPRDAIVSIEKTEFLGPLTLNDLHKLGHKRLPVISEDIDHVIGVLHLNRLFTLDVKRSVTAEKAMEPSVYYIRDNQTLNQALAAFLSTNDDLLIVVNEARETVGLLTLQDVIEALFGRKIVDEFDDHDNLRSVAGRI